MHRVTNDSWQNGRLRQGKHRHAQGTKETSHKSDNSCRSNHQECPNIPRWTAQQARGQPPQNNHHQIQAFEGFSRMNQKPRRQENTEPTYNGCFHWSVSLVLSSWHLFSHRPCVTISNQKTNGLIGILWRSPHTHTHHAMLGRFGRAPGMPWISQGFSRLTCLSPSSQRTSKDSQGAPISWHRPRTGSSPGTTQSTQPTMDP